MSEEEKHTIDLVERFWIKLQSKFKKLGDTFRFFDRNFDNKISLKEFRVVCEEFDMRFNSDELKKVFNYLINEGQTTIGYQEFTKLCDEKRLGQDPYINNKRASWEDFNDPFAQKPISDEQQKKKDDVMRIFEERK